MNEVVAGNYVLFDQVDYTQPASRGPRIAQDILALSDVAMRFARVERVPRYDCTSRENDAEHSFMLAMVASEIAQSYYVHLDPGLVSQFAIVHDLIELKTDDVATFTLNDTEMAAKEAAEQDALSGLAGELPAHTARLLLRYELQEEPEAHFVRLVDKALPVAVDILGPGRMVMQQDYCITTPQQLDANESRLSAKFRQKFPHPLLERVHEARDILAARFAAQFALEVSLDAS